MQELRVAKSLWGVHEAGDVNKWDELFSRIASEGYCACSRQLRLFFFVRNGPLKILEFLEILEFPWIFSIVVSCLVDVSSDCWWWPLVAKNPTGAEVVRGDAGGDLSPQGYRGCRYH